MLVTRVSTGEPSDSVRPKAALTLINHLKLKPNHPLDRPLSHLCQTLQMVFRTERLNSSFILLPLLEPKRNNCNSLPALFGLWPLEFGPEDTVCLCPDTRTTAVPSPALSSSRSSWEANQEVRSQPTSGACCSHVSPGPRSPSLSQHSPYLHENYSLPSATQHADECEPSVLSS